MKKLELSICLILFVLLCGTIITGCIEITDNSDNSLEEINSSNDSILTNSPKSNVSEDKSLNNYMSSSGVISERTPWPDVSPPYDDNTKKELIELAKEEIMRVFPDANESSFDGYWTEKNPENGFFSETLPYDPLIVFNSVDITTDEYRKYYYLRNGNFVTNPRNIATIKIDGLNGEIIYYRYDGMSTSPSKNEVKVVSLAEAENKSLEFIKIVKGEEFVDNIEGNFFTEKKDLDAENHCGYAYFLRTYSYDGIEDRGDSLFIRYDLYTDSLFYYDDDLKTDEEHEVLGAQVISPSITLADAKKIFESRLEDEYPDENLAINYIPYRSGKNLAFYETYNGTRVAWHLYFSDKEMREINSRSINAAVIDAENGDILGLRYRDIILPPYSEEEKEIMAKSGT